jgi:hypothetical protein
VVVIVMLVAHRGPDPLIIRDFLEKKRYSLMNSLFEKKKENDQDHDDRPGPESR